jgi:uncharacterized protein (TIGR02246 family)
MHYREEASMTLQDEVAAVNEQVVRALANQDAEGVIDVFADDALCLFPHEPLLQGRAAIEHFFRRVTSQGPTLLRWQAERLIEANGVVIEVGREWFRGEGETTEGPMK